MSKIHHICVCICTYKRPQQIVQLLSKLEEQEVEDLFDFSIVIADNDRAESARQTVESYARLSRIPIRYYVEPEQNIAIARNLTVSKSVGSDFVAFIDDDEIPIPKWLLSMYIALLKYKADGVFGPVYPLFSAEPPQWMVKAGLFERPSYEKTGSVINWKQTGMGNVLVRRSILDEVKGPFSPDFDCGGEDVDFFRRAVGLGKIFVWCGDATVHETVPVERTRLSFQLRRALLRGKASLATPSGSALGILKSVTACILYTMLFPLFLVMGRHVFIKYLVKVFDHIGKLLAVCGFSVIKEKYVLD